MAVTIEEVALSSVRRGNRSVRTQRPRRRRIRHLDGAVWNLATGDEGAPRVLRKSGGVVRAVAGVAIPSRLDSDGVEPLSDSYGLGGTADGRERKRRIIPEYGIAVRGADAEGSFEHPLIGVIRIRVHSVGDTDAH